MAVSSSTAANLVVGAGDVFLDAADVGATMDTNSFAVETEWYVPDLNGVPGELQGTRYKSSETVRLGVTIVELSGTKIIAALPGWDTATAGTITTVDTDDTRRVPSADYHDWILQVDGLDGVQYNFYADNAINDGGVSFEASDDGTMGMHAELISTWDGADMTTSPFRIKRMTGISS